MSVEIRVPALGESVTTATVARWLKQPGDTVAADEAVVELETDKVTAEINAPASGTLGPIVVAQGAEVELGALLGTIEASGVTAPSKPAAAPKVAPVKVAAPAAAEVAGEFDVIVIGSGPGGYVFAIRAAQLGL